MGCYFPLGGHSGGSRLQFCLSSTAALFPLALFFENRLEVLDVFVHPFFIFLSPSYLLFA